LCHQDISIIALKEAMFIYDKRFLFEKLAMRIDLIQKRIQIILQIEKRRSNLDLKLASNLLG